MNANLCLRQNVGTIDRIIRIILGLALVTVPPVIPLAPWLIALLAAFGGTQIIEGLIRY